jgi:DNA-binding CsgD family transcriptional regulator
MKAEPRILRTDTGYQIGQLHATGLTPRQSQVLLLRAEGNQVKQCAHALNCSSANVRQLLAELFYKLRANSSHELIARAFQAGHLRFLSVFALIGLCLCGNATNDNPNELARIGRSRSSLSVRLQRSGSKKSEAA